MQKVNFYLGIGLMLFGVAIAVFSSVQSGEGDQYGLSPAAIPMICGGLLFILALVLVVQNRPQVWLAEKKDAVITPENLKRVGIYIGLAVAGIIIMTYVGYIVSGIFVISCHMLVMGERSPVTIALWSVLPPVVLYGLIYYALAIPLP